MAVVYTMQRCLSQQCSTSSPLISSRFAAHSRRMPAPALRRQSCRGVRKAQLLRTHAAALDDYGAQLHKAEEDGDWLRAVELLTEVRVLKLDLPQPAYEAGIRTLCDGDQWQRAVELLRARQMGLSDDVTTVVFESLSRARAGAEALELFEAFYSDRAAPLHVPLLNRTIRALARGGQLDTALSMLNELAMDEERESEYQTFNVVAAECMFAGRQEEGLEVLEMRDYL